MARRRRLSRSALALRWFGAALLVLIAVAYVQPLRAYRQAGAELSERKAGVAALEREKKGLDERLAIARSDQFIVREARKLSLVRPGERLFIVTGLGGKP
ncbi:MAG: septum formation initiator family protein [Actinomycetota bacterium]|nr:septum formation initiator family protein [Actinomycetota bacterium]